MHTKRAYGPTHGKSLLMHPLAPEALSAAFLFTHYQNGNLSVAHTAESIQPITPFAFWTEGEEEEQASNRFSQQDHASTVRKNIFPGCETTLFCENGEGLQRGRNTEKLRLHPNSLVHLICILVPPILDMWRDVRNPVKERGNKKSFRLRLQGSISVLFSVITFK